MGLVDIYYNTTLFAIGSHTRKRKMNNYKLSKSLTTFAKI